MYAAAVDEHGELVGDERSAAGLDTSACLRWLVSLAETAGRQTNHHGTGPHLAVYGFALGYDLTRWLVDLPNRDLWKLLRPEARAVVRDGELVPNKRTPIWYEDPTGPTYRLDYLRGKLSVQRVDSKRWILVRRCGRLVKVPLFVGPRVTVWDVFTFFGQSFVKTLDSWQVGTQAERDAIAAMKERRADFDRCALYKVAAYCRSECRLLARLVRKLTEEHEREGWPLTAYHGAGSSGKAMLRAWKVKACVADPPDEARVPIARAFTAGRFETAWIGPIGRAVYADDLAAAYPYAMATVLPCLAHGGWTHRTEPRGLERAIAGASLALVRCRVRSTQRAWGVFPWRSKDGTITYPLTTDGTWVWRPEYEAAQSLAHVTALEAWLYHTDCDCAPFARMPDVYRRRVEIGSTAAGHTLKLGSNAGYGSIVQSLGASPFRSYVWGGMITSATRAKLLDAIAVARDPWSVVMVATDAVYSTERLHRRLPKPAPTGTSGLVRPDGRPAPGLGGWDETEHSDGLFVARPGLYWDLAQSDAPDESPDVRARGIGRSVMAEHARKIEEHWQAHAPYVSEYKLTVRRFVGAKSGVVRRPGKGGKLGPPRRDKDYGEWLDARPARVTFGPQPKRSALEVRRVGGAELVRLLPWFDPPPGERESSPYGPALGRPAVLSPDALMLRMLEDELADTGPDATDG